MSEKQILSLRSDGALSRKMVSRLGNENSKALRVAGIPATDSNKYLMHFLGPNAIKVIKGNRNAPIEQYVDREAVMSNRRVLEGKTVGQVIDWARKKMGA